MRIPRGKDEGEKRRLLGATVVTPGKNDTVGGAAGMNSGLVSGIESLVSAKPTTVWASLIDSSLLLFFFSTAAVCYNRSNWGPGGIYTSILYIYQAIASQSNKKG